MCDVEYLSSIETIAEFRFVSFELSRLKLLLQLVNHKFDILWFVNLSSSR